jgi:peptidoglycan/xylan/chitin deacetylase (PgdA/CDA1 family)
MQKMRIVGAAALLLSLSPGLLRPALAQGACEAGAGKLGVTRTATIDASAGPRFGSQYRDAGLLADGEVILTFDDGPSRAYTRPILEALLAHCTKAVFFMVGRMAMADPEMVKEVARQGHTVATHTWSHQNLQGLPADKVQAEIEMGFSAVQQALGKPIAPFFRFPYLRDTPSSLGYLQGRHLATVSIDIDSRDFETKDAAAVHARVLRELAAKRKGIILFHDIHASTARALPGLLTALKAGGFRVVHVTPKASVETLADYDALARQQAERKRLAGTGHPLAKRTFLWPSTTELPDAKVSDPVRAKAPAGIARRSPREPTEDDWTVNVWRQ